jgi:hypothetical protein
MTLGQSVKIKFIVASWVALSSFVGHGVQSALAAGEYEVKAAFILNFIKFTEWADTNRSTTAVCVYKDPDVFQTAKSLEGKRANESTLSLVLVEEPSTIEPCHVVFIPRGASDLGEVLKAAKGRGILTIGDTPDFLERGGMIGFLQEGDRIRFTISQQNASAQGLKFSAKLLALGVTISGN